MIVDDTTNSDRRSSDSKQVATVGLGIGWTKRGRPPCFSCFSDACRRENVTKTNCKSSYPTFRAWMIKMINPNHPCCFKGLLEDVIGSWNS